MRLDLLLQPSFQPLRRMRRAVVQDQSQSVDLTPQGFGDDHLQQEGLKVYEPFPQATLPIGLAISHTQSSEELQSPLSRKASGSRMCCQVWQRRGLSLSATSHRPTVLAAICNTSPNVSSRRAISALLHRGRGTPSSHGRVQARAVACARTSGGKTPGRSRLRQILNASRLFPLPHPARPAALGGHPHRRRIAGVRPCSRITG
jgi:hypothetical protein